MSNIEPRQEKSWPMRHKGLSLLSIATVLLLIGFHVGGVFIAAFFWFIYGGIKLWLRIFKGGHRYIARLQYEEQEKLRRERQVPPAT